MSQNKNLEIGSEYWLEKTNKCDIELHRTNTAVYLLSGRTALDYIIRDIKTARLFSSIVMPSYCCESMIEPFLRNGISVSFYDVKPYDTGIKLYYNSSDSSDAVLLLDYFGYENLDLPKLASQAKAAGKTVIYDGTHKLNGNASVETFVDYTFCSFRKWFFSNSASVEKKAGSWNINTDVLRRNTEYETLRNEAAKLKQDYINGKPVDKNDFLSRFTGAEKLLDHDYAGFLAEPESVERLFDINIKALVNKRRENAQSLLDVLHSINLSWLSVPIAVINDDDCPLFVPVMIEPELRILVKKYLIDNRIYCPCHWPLSEAHYSCGIEQNDRTFYKTELSLICDQRYELPDMDRIAETLKLFGDTI